MADASLLSAILAGNDPLAAQMLQGYQGSQLSNAALDPNFGHNEGPFGALAKVIAGVRGGGMTNDAVNTLTQARATARPDTLAAYNNPSGPLAYAAAHPDMNPQSLAQVLATPPEGVQNYIEAARLGRMNAPGAAPLVPGAANPVALPGYGKLNAPTPTAAAAPTGNIAALGSGRYPASPSPAADAASADPIVAAAGASPQQRQAMVQNPQQRAAILQRLRVLAAQRMAAHQSGAGNAAQPQP